MTNKVILQTPIESELKIQAEKKAHEMGFGSLQDMTRFFIVQIVNGNYSFQLTQTDTVEYLSPKEEARLDKIYEGYLEDKKAGKVKTYTNVNDMLKDLSK
jgi:antitoxin component of RelBE/YafQ-DinJ toxin-antitoxin module